ncbi:MAG: acetyltransferase [Gammaproteobacteria bacterium]
MLLKDIKRDELVEVLALNELFDPFSDELTGRYNHGEEAQDPEKFKKTDLVFQSGEALPRCWLDAHYRDSEFSR